MAGEGLYRFLLRMPEELRIRLNDAASASGRSLNKEIVNRLADSFEPKSAGPHKGSTGFPPSQGRDMGKRFSPRVRFGVAVALVVLAAAMVGMLASSGGRPSASHTFKKGDPDSSVKALAGIPNEGPDATAAAQQEAERAYPADSVPDVAAANSQAAFAALVGKGKGQGSWQQIGPSQAKYPALLDQFLAGGHEYTASGRVTALAIGGCKNGNKCSLYLGAAGGGLWVADKATDRNGQVNWQFKGAGLPSNAIGSLLVDPSDPTGNTVYAGTGEGNASADSEAGLGIYKTTDGGNTWSLVPGSMTFRDRAIGTMAFDGAGNLLVGIASAVRGISSVSSGGAIGCPTPTSPPGCSVRGVYRQTGSTFTLLWPCNVACLRGVNEIRIDPNNPNIIYASSFGQGIWRSLNNGGTWTQILAAVAPGVNTDRAEFALAKLPGGFTRMYAGIGNSLAGLSNRGQFFRTDDAAGAAVFTNMTTPQNAGYCGYSGARSAGTTTSSTRRPKTRTSSISRARSTTTASTARTTAARCSCRPTLV